jgi:hypothetical protein
MVAAVGIVEREFQCGAFEVVLFSNVVEIQVACFPGNG